MTFIALAVLRDYVPFINSVISYNSTVDTFFAGIRDTIQSVLGGNLLAGITLIFSPLAGVLTCIRFLKDQKDQKTSLISTFDATLAGKEAEFKTSLSGLTSQLNIQQGLTEKYEGLYNEVTSKFTGVTQLVVAKDEALLQANEQVKQLEQQLAAIQAYV